MPTEVTGDDARGLFSYCGHDAPVIIPDFGPASCDDGQGGFRGYPISMAIHDTTTIVSELSLNLIGLSHTYGSDLSILLTKADRFTQRVRNGIMMCRCFGPGRQMNNVNVTLNQTGTKLPRLSATPFLGGTFSPASYVSFRSDTENPYGPGASPDGGWPVDTLFGAVPPRPPYNIGFADFIGGHLDGCWNLYIFDEKGGDGGRLNDWQIVANGVTYGRPQTIVTAEPA